MVGLTFFQHPEAQRGEILHRGNGGVPGIVLDGDLTVELVVAVLVVTGRGGSRDRGLINSRRAVKTEIVGLTVQLELNTLNCHKITLHCKILRHTDLLGTPS